MQRLVNHPNYIFLGKTILGTFQHTIILWITYQSLGCNMVLHVVGVLYAPPEIFADSLCNLKMNVTPILCQHGPTTRKSKQNV